MDMTKLLLITLCPMLSALHSLPYAPCPLRAGKAYILVIDSICEMKLQ